MNNRDLCKLVACLADDDGQPRPIAYISLIQCLSLIRNDFITGNKIVPKKHDIKEKQKKQETHRQTLGAPKVLKR